MKNKSIIEWIKNRPTLRWIIFIPVAAISVLIINIIWILFNSLTASFIFPRGGFVHNLFHFGVSGMITGFVTIYVSVLVVPTKKYSVSIILLTIIVIFSCLLILMYIASKDYWMLFSILTIIIGSFMAHYYLKGDNFEVG